jgi:hypothetical protein
MQVYLPADLYEKLKSHCLLASELLQNAVRDELRRRELLAASKRYTAELVADVGAPTRRQRARAAEVARRIAGRSPRRLRQAG